MLWKRFAQPITAVAKRGLSRPPRANERVVQTTFKRYYSNPQGTGQYNPDPTDQDEGEGEKSKGSKDSDPNLKSTILKMLETAATTAASIAILG